MRFASLGSGSKGNATVVDCGKSRFLVDCGFSIRETERRLQRLELTPADISAVLVTHEHTDHLRGVLPLAKKYNIQVVMTAGTSKVLKSPHASLTLIDSHSPFECDGVMITPVSVPHDAREPVQYIFSSHGLRLGVLTDIGSITSHVVDEYSGCDGLLLECNHDLQMLLSGTYPQALKQRISSPWGHLSNDQSLALLESLDLRRMQHLVVGHISQQNNALDIVQELMQEIDSRLPSVHYACQEEGFDWLELKAS